MTDGMPVTLGGYVRARREAMHLSLTELARRADLTKSELSAIENGKIGWPGADKRRRLADVLGIRHVDLVVAAGELAPDEVEPPPVDHIHDHRLQRVVASWPRLRPEVQATMHDWSTQAAFLRDEEPEPVALAR